MQNILANTFMVSKYAFYGLLAIAAFHVVVLAFMILGIASGDPSIQHTAYWDGILRTVVHFIS